MKARNTLILVAIFALLAGYVYFVEMRKEEEIEEKPLTIFDLATEEVESLEVRDNVEPSVVRLVKDKEGNWRIEEPFSEEADQVRVEGLVGRVAKMSASRVVTETAADLAPFGLAEPPLTVRVGLAGEEGILQVGDKNPRGSAYYVQREGDEAVYLVYAGLIDDLKRLITEPPKKPTPTPTATIAPTPAVTPTATATPTATPAS